jgi:hypothetical protein
LIELWIRGSGVFSIVITAGIVVIVIVTHNLQQARRIADATAFFLSGDLVELAETNVLFNSPSDEYAPGGGEGLARQLSGLRISIDMDLGMTMTRWSFEGSARPARSGRPRRRPSTP